MQCLLGHDESVSVTQSQLVKLIFVLIVSNISACPGINRLQLSLQQGWLI